MNLDKGNQFNGGANMSVIGDVAKPDDGTENYVPLLRHQHGQPFTVTTAGDGSLWLIFATDSGFEGQTALYYTRLIVWINRADEPYLWLERDSVPGTLRLIWNQGTLRSTTTLGSDWTRVPVATRPYTYSMDVEPRRFWRAPSHKCHPSWRHSRGEQYIGANCEPTERLAGEGVGLWRLACSRSSFNLSGKL
jgi:hypothetical protein